MTETEEEVLKKYSTPGLRRNQFDYQQKKDWLSYAYPRMDREERDKILNDLFSGVSHTNAT